MSNITTYLDEIEGKLNKQVTQSEAIHIAVTEFTPVLRSLIAIVRRQNEALTEIRKFSVNEFAVNEANRARTEVAAIIEKGRSGE